MLDDVGETEQSSDVTDTVDPAGPWVLIGTVAYCLCTQLFLLLPFCLGSWKNPRFGDFSVLHFRFERCCKDEDPDDQHLDESDGADFVAPVERRAAREAEERLIKSSDQCDGGEDEGGALPRAEADGARIDNKGSWDFNLKGPCTPLNPLRRATWTPPFSETQKGELGVINNVPAYGSLASEKEESRILLDRNEEVENSFTRSRSTSSLSTTSGCVADLAAFDNETKRILRLALPFTASTLVEALASNLILIIVSLNLGTSAVSAYAVVNMMMGVTHEFLLGIIHSEDTLCSHAYGAGNMDLVGKHLQICSLVFVALQVPFMIGWSLFTYDMMLWFGFDTIAAESAQSYARIAVFHCAFDGLSIAYHTVLCVAEREIYSAFIGAAEAVVEVGLIAMAVIVFDVGIVGVAVISLVTVIAFYILNIGYTIFRGWMNPFLAGMIGEIELRDPRLLVKILRTAIPLGCGSLVMYGEWEALTFFAAHNGPIEVATWAILGTIWETFEVSINGIGDASEIRVAYHLGNGDPDMARTSAYKSILLGFLSSILLTSVLLSMGNSLPTWFTSDPAMQHMLWKLLPLVGIGNVTMAGGMIAWSLVGAQGRFRLATTVISLASWLVTIPLGALSVYLFNIGLQGLTAAVAIGYSTAGTVLFFILMQSDWEVLSRNVVADASDDTTSEG